MLMGVQIGVESVLEGEVGRKVEGGGKEGWLKLTVEWDLMASTCLDN